MASFIRGLKLFERFNQEPVEVTRGRIHEHFSRCLTDDCPSIYLACDAAGGILGFLSVHWLPYLILQGPEGFISELFIHSEHRGQGLGKRLLEHAKAEAAARGCGRMGLINIRDRESYQRGFYAKAGWQERKDAANFIYALPE
ncbi:MAG TPA: GNAT family N-acetyltransferase [Holophaga sp.]|nr:GNAT family N-acetyltransferase [Holophaga sp.]